jgi:hypothetical protein
MTWLAPHVYVWNLLTHFTVAWEISFCALIWFPLLRPLVLAFAIPLHLGIGLCLGMWTFGLVMLIGCSAFLSPRLVRRMLRLSRPPQTTWDSLPISTVSITPRSGQPAQAHLVG